MASISNLKSTTKEKDFLLLAWIIKEKNSCWLSFVLENTTAKSDCQATVVPTWASSTLIILFSEMLNFSKHFFSKKPERIR
jgi:hypothetical protein